MSGVVFVGSKGDGSKDPEKRRGKGSAEERRTRREGVKIRNEGQREKEKNEKR